MSVRLKTINADEAAYEGFRQLAKECDLTSPELVSAMVQYFRVTKADPRNPTGPDLTTSLAKITAKLADLDKRTIGFIREQEKQYLKPILAEVQAYKALSTPVESASAEESPTVADTKTGMSEPQLAEIEEWLKLVIRRNFKPDFRHPSLRNADPPTMTSSPELAPLRKLFTSALGKELNPIVFVPRVPEPASVTANSLPSSTPSQPA
jgi:hypothetical protein